MSFEEGATVYDRAGREYEYIQAFGPGHMVYPVIDVDGEGEIDEPVYLGRVWSEAPTPRNSEMVASVKAELTRLRAEADTARQALRDAQSERDAGLKALSALSHLGEAVERVSDFLLGKVTHVFIVDVHPRIVSLADLDEASRARGYQDGGLPLVTLWGQTNGDLQWRINRYRDDSGGWADCFPCRSEDEARDRARAYIAQLVRDDQLHDASRIDASLGLDGMDPATRTAISAWRRADDEQRLARLVEQVAKTQAKVDEVWARLGGEG